NQGNAIAVDSFNNAYVSGCTSSAEFPTLGAYQPTFHGGGGIISTGCGDAFVTKLHSTGSHLIYSTYLGGSKEDRASGIAVNSSGEAFVVGNTFSADFPTKNPFQPTCGGCNSGRTLHDVFLTKFDAAGVNLVYSTFLGGSDHEEGASVAIDTSGNAY